MTPPNDAKTVLEKCWITDPTGDRTFCKWCLWTKPQHNPECPCEALRQQAERVEAFPWFLLREAADFVLRSTLGLTSDQDARNLAYRLASALAAWGTAEGEETP